MVGRYPEALLPVLENFLRAFFPDPTDCPWVSEDGRPHVNYCPSCGTLIMRSKKDKMVDGSSRGHGVSFPRMGPLVWLLMLGDGSFSSFSGPHEAYYSNPLSNKTDTCGRGFKVGGSWGHVKKMSQEFPFSISFQNEVKTPDRRLRVTTLTHFNRFLLYNRGFIHAHYKSICWK